MIGMLLVGYCFAIRSERRLCHEVHLNLACRWFCRLGLDAGCRTIRPSRSTAMGASARARPSGCCSRAWCDAAWQGVLSAVRGSPSMLASRRPMPRAITACPVMSRSTGPTQSAAPERYASVWRRSTRPQRRPASRRRCSPCPIRANKRVMFGNALNYLNDTEHAIIVDVEATPARTYDEVAAIQLLSQWRLIQPPPRVDASPRTVPCRAGAWLLYGMLSGRDRSGASRRRAESMLMHAGRHHRWFEDRGRGSRGREHGSAHR